MEDEEVQHQEGATEISDLRTEIAELRGQLVTMVEAFGRNSEERWQTIQDTLLKLSTSTTSEEIPSEVQAAETTSEQPIQVVEIPVEPDEKEEAAVQQPKKKHFFF